MSLPLGNPGSATGSTVEIINNPFVVGAVFIWIFKDHLLSTDMLLLRVLICDKKKKIHPCGPTDKFVQMLIPLGHHSCIIVRNYSNTLQSFLLFFTFSLCIYVVYVLFVCFFFLLSPLWSLFILHFHVYVSLSIFPSTKSLLCSK